MNTFAHDLFRELSEINKPEQSPSILDDYTKEYIEYRNLRNAGYSHTELVNVGIARPEFEYMYFVGK